MIIIAALKPSYTAKNGPFDTVEDLLWVRGMTPELFYGYRRCPGGSSGEGRKGRSAGDFYCG